ncbi:MAG: maleylpyruvate isomerase N-terminal domain-containing protein [Bifidobacteriaceae bacterium]|jgi:hypothetical protein|nr:maleylpyruvate isomerase N-terminal domain-containing protein [Bifidobacteriaceae bacterium]
MAVGPERLAWEVGELACLFKLLGEDQLRIRVYPEWDALDVLRHVVWWHESFAAIAKAAAGGDKPVVPRGALHEVNAQSVADLKQAGVTALIRRLNAAQRQVEACAALPAGTMLDYRRGSRRYSYPERIDVSVGEMGEHRRDVLKAVLSDRSGDVASLCPLGPGQRRDTGRAGPH